MFPIKYHEPIFRPPSEGKSLLIQLTYGCSNNLCTYCDMYRSKKYTVRSFDEVKLDIDKAYDFYSKLGYPVKRIFLCDGDALGAPFELLKNVLLYINSKFSQLERVGIYATADNILLKSLAELRTLHSLKLSIAYLGIESGSDEVLKKIVKGNTQTDMIEAGIKIKKAGWKISNMFMLGIAGKNGMDKHIEESAFVINSIKPNYLSFLTTMAIPGTPYYRMVSRPNFKLSTTKDLLFEMKEIVSKLKLSPNDEIVFRANHVSNMVPVRGNLPHDQVQVLDNLEHWYQNCPENLYPELPDTF